MPTAREGAPPVRENMVCSPTTSVNCCISAGVTGYPQDEMVAVAAVGSAPDNSGRAVDGEVDSRLKDAGCDHRHDSDKRFHEHRTIADQPRLPFLGDQLRSRSGGDQRMEAGNCAAGDCDECERKNLAGENRPGAVNKARQRRHCQRGPNRQYSQGEKKDRSEFDKSAQIIARRQEQPYGQNGSRKSIGDDHPRKMARVKSEQRRQPGRLEPHTGRQ